MSFYFYPEGDAEAVINEGQEFKINLFGDATFVMGAYDSVNQQRIATCTSIGDNSYISVGDT